MSRPDPLSDGDVLGQEPAMMQWALALTKDPVEAKALVAQTLAAALAEGRPADRAGLFRTFRQTYHSIERGRRRPSLRDATAAARAGAPGEAAAVEIA